MDNQYAKDIIAMLPDDRTLFRYFPDRYALMLLDYATRNGTSISQIKASDFAKLLQRPAVKKMIAGQGGGNFAANDIALQWPLETQSYVLTLGLWGSRIAKDRDWYQTTRAGTNLVLQLNFDKAHDGAYEKLLAPFRRSDFSYDGHPINRKGRKTLAWSRIDLDLDSGEALIEELQSDWVRNAFAFCKEIADNTSVGEKLRQSAERYSTQFLEPHIKMWAEAMLAATLYFLIEEIGIKNIWLHDFDSGNLLKKLRWSQPPRSLYTKLPKRFCFDKVVEAPKFLFDGVSRAQRKRFNNGKDRFWKLAV